MSFRLFVYYCALIGAWAAMVGWLVGRWLTDRFVAPESLVWLAGVRGLALGVFVALGLGLVDAGRNLGLRNWGQMAGRLSTAMAIGGLGGLAGGAAAQYLVVLTGHEATFFVGGWTLAGLVVGASVCTLEWVLSFFSPDDRKAAGSKFLKCMLGGAVGGLIGGLFAYLVRELWLKLFSDKEPTLLWSPTAIGFVTLGLAIGLLVGLAQVFLREAWVRVEAGFRPGRELILAKDATLIGRAEGSDIPLFGDPAVDKTHARIVRESGRFFVVDEGSPTGTLVNGKKVTRAKAPLRSGDVIRVGKSELRFLEQDKR